MISSTPCAKLSNTNPSDALSNTLSKNNNTNKKSWIRVARAQDIAFRQQGKPWSALNFPNSKENTNYVGIAPPFHFCHEELLGLRGVSGPSSQGYVASIRVDEKRYYLGTFADKLQAAKAYDDGVKLYGRDVELLNFPGVDQQMHSTRCRVKYMPFMHKMQQRKSDWYKKFMRSDFEEQQSSSSSSSAAIPEMLPLVAITTTKTNDAGTKGKLTNSELLSMALSDEDLQSFLHSLTASSSSSSSSSSLEQNMVRTIDLLRKARSCDTNWGTGEVKLFIKGIPGWKKKRTKSGTVNSSYYMAPNGRRFETIGDVQFFLDSLIEAERSEKKETTRKRPRDEVMAPSSSSSSSHHHHHDAVIVSQQLPLSKKRQMTVKIHTSKTQLWL